MRRRIRFPRRLSRAVAVVLAAMAAVILISPAPSSADAPQATGWWSRRVPFTGEVEPQSSARAVPYTPQQDVPTDPTVPVDTTVPGGGPVTTLPPPVPPPPLPDPPVTLPEDPGPGTPNPTVPEGGLWVANDPAGPVAISALRYRGDIGSAELKLAFAPGSTTVGPVVACPALSDWQPGPEGAWADRPAHDCDRLSISGGVATDGTAMTFAIPQSFLPFGQRVLDIILLPDPASGDVFSLMFQAPGDDSLQVIAGQELPLASPEIQPLAPSSLPSSSFSPPAPEVVVPSSPITVASPATPSTDVAAPRERSRSVEVPEPISDVLEPFTESRTSRIIAVMTLLAMGGALWYFGGTPVRQPRLLGALAGDVAAIVDQAGDGGRGIGRFRRHRSQPPNRL